MKRFVLFQIMLASALVGLFAQPMQEQVKLDARVKNTMFIDGLQFKDLNSNGKLDAYEDWRLSATERSQDLINQMTLEERPE